MTITATAYRDAISRFLTGITVVTTRHGTQSHGITVSAVASVSLEPPTLLVCLNRQSATCEAIGRAGHFAVNVLAENQLALAQHFASKSPDKFSTLPSDNDTPSWREGVLGAPLLADALAHLECRVASTSDIGTHRIFFGEVAAAQATDGAPLAYFRGQFLTLAR